MQQVVVDGGDVQKVLGEAALVFLYLEIVFVLGKILGHGNEFVTDFVPHGQRLACAGERRTGSLSLHLVLGGEPRSSDRKQGKRNERRQNRLILDSPWLRNTRGGTRDSLGLLSMGRPWLLGSLLRAATNPTRATSQSTHGAVRYLGEAMAQSV